MEKNILSLDSEESMEMGRSPVKYQKFLLVSLFNLSLSFLSEI